MRVFLTFQKVTQSEKYEKYVDGSGNILIYYFTVLGGK